MKKQNAEIQESKTKPSKGLSVLEEILNDDITSDFLSLDTHKEDDLLDVSKIDEIASEEYNDIGAQFEDDNYHAYNLSDQEKEKLKNIANLPRITIDAFIERNITGQLLEEVHNDRRMLRTIINIEAGGIAGALRAYQKSVTPNLIIIELTKPLHQILSFCEKFSQICDENSKVMIIGIENDIEIYRELIARGVSDYIVLPNSPVDILLAIAGIFNKIDNYINGKSIAFIGARGGVGASTMAHNVGYSIAEDHKKNCALLDLDLSFGTVSLDFEQNPNSHLTDFLAKPDKIDQVMLDRSIKQYTQRFGVMVAPNSLRDNFEYSTDSYLALIDSLKQAVPNVILDFPSSWSGWIKQSMLAADKIVIVASSDIVSFRNVQNLLEFFHEHRKSDDRPNIILNQVGIPKRPEISVQQFKDNLGVSPDLVVKWEPTLFGSSSNNGAPILEIAGNSNVALDIKKFSSKVASGETVQIEEEVVNKLSVADIIKSIFKF